MANGANWSTHWFVDGEEDQPSSVANQQWGGGESGTWWVCLSNDNGLPDAVYELVLEVEGRLVVTDAVFVGGNRVLANLTVVNSSPHAACTINVSPSRALNWGQDDLGTGTELPPGQSARIELATGAYDIRVLDRQGGVLREELAVEITEEYQLDLDE